MKMQKVQKMQHIKNIIKYHQSVIDIEFIKS